MTLWIGVALLVLGALASAFGGGAGIALLAAGLACTLVGLVLRSHKKTRDQMWEAELERKLDAQFGPEDD